MLVGAAATAGAVSGARENGGRYWDRTSDLYDVNVALSPPTGSWRYLRSSVQLNF